MMKYTLTDSFFMFTKYIIANARMSPRRKSPIRSSDENEKSFIQYYNFIKIFVILDIHFSIFQKFV